MTPKSYGDVFVYLWAVTGLPWGLAMAAILKGDPAVWAVGGALFGLGMAAFGTPRLVGKTVSLPIAGVQDDKIARLNIAAAQSGYAPASQTGELFVYDATEGSSFTVGPIKVAPAAYLRLWAQFGNEGLTLVGPTKTVDDVHARLAG